MKIINVEELLKNGQCDHLIKNRDQKICEMEKELELNPNDKQLKALIRAGKIPTR